MMLDEKQLALLGHKVRDTVTGFTGVVTSISFDLYGCVQAIVTPSIAAQIAHASTDVEQKLSDSGWFDVKRLEQLSKQPVMDLPTFDMVPGGQKLPQYPSKPQA